MAINDITLGAHFGDNFVLDAGTEKILVKIDGVSIVQAADGTLSAVAEDAAGTAFDPAGNILTSTDTQGAIEEVLTLLSGVAHTSITDIDLQATANPNEFTVVITWVDENGATQTTTDATPVTISGATQVIVSTDPGNLLTAGTDLGALITSADICTSVTNDCLAPCQITDMFGNVIGELTEFQ